MAELDHTNTDPALCETCALSTVRKGDLLEIMSVDDDHARVQALRFGMSQGACVECITRIPAGPIVLRSGRQEIAVGRSLAGRIQVRKRIHAQLVPCRAQPNRRAPTRFATATPPAPMPAKASTRWFSQATPT